MLIVSATRFTTEPPWVLVVRLTLLEPLTPYTSVWVLLTNRMGCCP